MAKRHTTVNGRQVQKSHLVWNAYRPDNPVRDGEVIHHINGDPEDNRAENLVKMTLAEHEALHSRERWSDPAMRQKILDAQRDELARTLEERSTT